LLLPCFQPRRLEAVVQRIAASKLDHAVAIFITRTGRFGLVRRIRGGNKQNAVQTKGVRRLAGNG
jgi:hypothetical protein